MNLTARTVTRLAGLPSHGGPERERARRAPVRSAGYARRYAAYGAGPIMRRALDPANLLVAFFSLLLAGSILSLGDTLFTFPSLESQPVLIERAERSDDKYRLTIFNRSEKAVASVILVFAGSA